GEVRVLHDLADLLPDIVRDLLVRFGEQKSVRESAEEGQPTASPAFVEDAPPRVIVDRDGRFRRRRLPASEAHHRSAVRFAKLAIVLLREFELAITQWTV